MSEIEKRYKIESIKEVRLANRVNLILSKQKKRIERKNIPKNKEEKFTKSMDIFKNLDTFFETKGFMCHLNDLNKSE